MKQNVGGIDRILRLALGGVLMGLSYADILGGWGWPVGGIILATGLVGWCPFYPLAGYNTIKKKQA